jgi:CheY-like chemotaxis protein
VSANSSFALREEALAALTAEPDIELMLLDINMPVMDAATGARSSPDRRRESRIHLCRLCGRATIVVALHTLRPKSHESPDARSARLH